MDDLKDILVFIGLNTGIFIKNLLWFLLVMFIVIGLTMVIFYMNFRFIKNNLFIGFFILILLILNYYLKKILYLKNQAVLNSRFCKYLKNSTDLNTSDVSGNEYVSDSFFVDLKKIFSQRSQHLKESGFHLITRKVLLALSILSLANNKSLRLTQDVSDRLQTLIRKQVFIEVSLIGMILLPFALISLLLSIGLWSGLKCLIFVLAYIFVYYIYSSIFEPILFLFIQKKVYEIYS